MSINRKPLLSHTGRALLNRRNFLGSSFYGLGGIALASLLGTDRVLGADAPVGRVHQPIRPIIAPAAPCAPRGAHFAPKAKRILVIFSTGACSQHETFDYKPEL